MNYIDKNLYAYIKSVMPIPCVDIIVMSESGLICLAKRVNEPLKGEWFAFGGRVIKGKNRKENVIGKLYDEASILALDIKNILELVSTDFMADINNTSLHCITTVYKAVVDNRYIDNIILDEQHSEYKWLNKHNWLVTENLHELIIDAFKMI